MNAIKTQVVLFAVLIGVLMGIVISARLDLNGPSSGEEANAVLAEKQRKAVPPADAMKVAEALSDASAWVAEKAMPAVVSITVLKRQRGFPNFDIFRGWYFPERTIQGMGSGFFVSPDGYIITNYHVVANADKIQVKLADERELPGKVAGVAEKLDLAVVKVEGKNFPYLKLGDSDKIRVGEMVFAIGAPFGLRHTLTQGIISARDRVDMNLTQVEDFIQTDAAVNPGNSGGPLLNIHAEVIGVNTAINTRSGGYDGISFAIPSNVARFAFEKIRKGEPIEGGYIGVLIEDVTQEKAEEAGLPSPMGCYIKDVLKGGPADKGGLEPGDIVLEVDGRKVRDRLSFFNRIYFHSPGDRVKLKVRRDGKDVELTVVVAKRTKEALKKFEEQQREQLQKEAVTVHGATVRRNDENDRGGVVVLKVKPGSPAARAGLQEGDVVLEVDGREVGGPEDFKRLFSKAVERGDVTLKLVRNMATILIRIQGISEGGDEGGGELW